MTFRPTRRATRLCAATAVAALALTTAPPSVHFPTMSAEAQTRVSVSVFYDQLAPHGRWLRTPRYGYVFVPIGIAPDWRPYTIGRWVWVVDTGWCWVSDEPHGWATHHYGRWDYDDGYGWYWVPGTRWAPAWVRWSRSDDYIGWAPLPPTGRGLVVGFSIGNIDVGIGAWRFVRVTDFLTPNLRTVIVEPRRNDEILRAASPAGTVRVVQNRVVNTVINVNVIERAVNRPVETYRLADRGGQPGQARVEGNTVQAFRPTVNPDQQARPPRAVEARELRNQIGQVRPDAPARGSGRAETEQPAATDQPGAPGTPAQVPGQAAPGQAAPAPGTVPGAPGKAGEAPKRPDTGTAGKGPDAKQPTARTEPKDGKGPVVRGERYRAPDGRDDRDIRREDRGARTPQGGANRPGVDDDDGSPPARKAPQRSRVDRDDDDARPGRARSGDGGASGARRSGRDDEDARPGRSRAGEGGGPPLRERAQPRPDSGPREGGPRTGVSPGGGGPRGGDAGGSRGLGAGPGPGGGGPGGAAGPSGPGGGGPAGPQRGRE